MTPSHTPFPLTVIIDGSQEILALKITEKNSGVRSQESGVRRLLRMNPRG
ncbi:MAG: hypothetical protein AB1589_23205 [Cyanobacteriota bacterium]